MRIVTTIDNLPRKTAPVRVIAHANSARYRPYVRLALSIDSRKMIDLYMRFYPLFQMAHIELGYPRGYFNDRLIAAIDDLLAAPVIGEPIRLTQPRVLYQFMEEDLEACSAGQKVMMRMGQDNERNIMTKLREIRAQLIASGAKQ